MPFIIGNKNNNPEVDKAISTVVTALAAAGDPSAQALVDLDTKRLKPGQRAALEMCERIAQHVGVATKQEAFHLAARSFREAAMGTKSKKIPASWGEK